MQVQSIIFDKNIFTKQKAITWLKSHKYKHKKIHETDDYYRFRQINPIFPAYRTKQIAPGVKFIIGKNTKITI